MEKIKKKQFLLTCYFFVGKVTENVHSDKITTQLVSVKLNVNIFQILLYWQVSLIFKVDFSKWVQAKNYQAQLRVSTAIVINFQRVKETGCS